ncbi:MAG TPA: hypothetical protein VGN04_15000 [Herbaspirillum sp.]|jgi:hypothetical protein
MPGTSLGDFCWLLLVIAGYCRLAVAGLILPAGFAGRCLPPITVKTKTLLTDRSVEFIIVENLPAGKRFLARSKKQPKESGARIDSMREPAPRSLPLSSLKEPPCPAIR